VLVIFFWYWCRYEQVCIVVGYSVYIADIIINIRGSDGKSKRHRGIHK